MNNKAFFQLTVKTVDEEKRIIEGTATTPAPDRVGDVVEPLGAKFSLPLPLLWQHDSRQPVGQVEWAKASAEGIKFRAKMVKTDEPGKLKDRLDEAWQSIKLGLVRGVSVGFRALETSYIRDGGIRFRKWNWLELSLVTIPANADATIQQIKAALGKCDSAASATAIHYVKAALGMDANKSPGATGNPKEMRTMKTVADRIKEAVEALEPKEARLSEIMNAAFEADREPDDAEAQELDALKAEILGLRKQLSNLRVMEGSENTAKTISASTSVEAAASRGGRPSHTAYPEAQKEVPDEKKGLGLARVVSAWLFSKACLEQGEVRTVASILKERYPSLPGREIAAMKEACDLMVKAQVEGATTTDPTYAAPFVTPANLLSEFVSYLRPRTILGRFGVGGIPSLRRIPFNVRFPAQTSGGAGYWVGEGRAKPLTRFDFSTVTLGYYKVANIAVLSEELVRLSAPSAEMAIRDALAEALQERMDTDFVDPTVTLTAGVRPASITYGAATAVCSGVDADAVRNDINSLLTVMVANYIPTGSVVLIMRTAQALKLSLMRNALGQREFPDITMNGGLLEGFPVITSQYVPSGVVIAMAANEIYLSDDGGFSVALSREASLEMDSTPSSKINDGSSPPVSVEATMVSMFQTNSVAVRAERWINWQRRRTAAVVYLTGVGWGGEDVSPIVEI